MADQLDFNYPESANGEKVMVPALGGSTTVAYDASAAMTSDLATTFGSASKWVAVRVTVTTPAFITSAVTPTALATGAHHYIPAGLEQDLRFPADHKIALIKAGATLGSAYITLLK